MVGNPISNSESNPFKTRLTLLMISCLVFAGAILGRAGWVQIKKDSRLEHMSRRQFQSKVLVRPRRGAILDRNGEPLAINSEISSLAANPLKIRNPKMLARLLAKATGVPYAKLLQRLREKKEFIWIKRHIPEAELSRLKKWRVMDPDGDLVSGLFLVKESQRVYPHHELAAHILGDVNIDLDGLEGVELRMNERLRGKVISVSAIKDALGRPTFIDAVAAKHVQDGEPVTLTIDASLQFAVEEELRNAVHKANARAGSVLVMNAVTGEILAMANEPSFVPNQKGNSADRRRNRLVTDGFEPGSTLKTILVASALSNGWKLSDHIWGERGQFQVQGKKISEAEAHEKFEWLTLKKLLKVSSNIGAAKLALKLGADRYYNSLQAFGFGAKTNVGFPGEIAGRIPSRKSWQPLSLANIGFGQGILVTRLQMARAYATILNGGWLVQPTLVKAPPEAVKPEPPRRILSEKACHQLIEALEAVTQDGGTGTKSALEGYRVAGKTGTAQVVEPGTGSYSRSKFIASFIGFAVGVEPKFVILTTIDEPRGIYYASETAAPLFRQVLNAVANRFSLPTTVPLNTTPQILAKKAGEPAPVINETIRVTQAKSTQGLVPTLVPALVPASLEFEIRGPALAGKAAELNAPLAENELPAEQSDSNFAWSMPALTGLTPREAIRMLQGHRFRLEIRGMGLIQTQFPPEGKAISENGTIRLQLTEDL
ncbi:MAG TPA: penicillin-binding transpeptidase domain-containing protein [Bdellovibrionota bacterium]|nr:penicillin-binding transpeptidase domain-containing protein [Bdellovibrionota bacterium]